MQPTPPACATCKHRIFGDVCEAFQATPIPDDILNGTNPHTEPVDGDNGIRYEAVEIEGGG